MIQNIMNKIKNKLQGREKHCLKHDVKYYFRPCIECTVDEIRHNKMVDGMKRIREQVR